MLSGAGASWKGGGDISGAVSEDGPGMAGEEPAIPGEMARSSMSRADISGPGGSAMVFRF